MRQKTAKVMIAQIEVICAYCNKVIKGQTGIVRLSQGADVIREDLAKVQDTPYHNAFSLRETIKCRECGEVNKVPKNWQRNVW